MDAASLPEKDIGDLFLLLTFDTNRLMMGVWGSDSQLIIFSFFDGGTVATMMIAMMNLQEEDNFVKRSNLPRI